MTRRDKLVERIRRRPPTAKFSDVRSLLQEDVDGSTTGQLEVTISFTKPGERTLPVPVHNGDVKGVYLDRSAPCWTWILRIETD